MERMNWKRVSKSKNVAIVVLSSITTGAAFLSIGFSTLRLGGPLGFAMRYAEDFTWVYFPLVILLLLVSGYIVTLILGFVITLLLTVLGFKPRNMVELLYGDEFEPDNEYSSYRLRDMNPSFFVIVAFITSFSLTLGHQAILNQPELADELLFLMEVEDKQRLD